MFTSLNLVSEFKQFLKCMNVSLIYWLQSKKKIKNKKIKGSFEYFVIHRKLKLLLQVIIGYVTWSNPCTEILFKGEWNSCWCMAKPTQYCKVINLQLNKFI